LNEIDFYKKFNFNIFEFNGYHLTDNTKSPVASHYFGCLIKGEAKIKTHDTELLLYPTEIFYIPKGLKYQSQWFGKDGEEIKFYSFGFEISPMNKPFILQKINCSDRAKEIFSELCDEINSPQKSIGKLYYFFELVAKEMKITENSHINPIIEKAVEYMTDNPHLKISHIAKYCNISEPSIYILFKKHLNKTPNEIKNKILCEKAIALLTTTNKPIQEISDTLGFSSTSYFRKILYKHTCKTPREIRKEGVF
jgi:AraC-like DNA-binding protein